MRVLALLLAAFSVCSVASAADDRKPRLILDADTGNEIDDLFAILRVLSQDRFEVVGLTSAQWRHHLGPDDSVAVSQRDNEELLKLAGRLDIPHPIGSADPFGKPWGGTDAADSPAARFIVDQANNTPDGEKLVVVCTGASTNLASALKLAPEIASRIKAYVIGFRYDAASGVWNKSEFNVRRDLDAADFLLNQEGLELVIMPANVSESVVFDRDDTFARLDDLGAVGEFLKGKWQRKFPDHTRWTMWDVALVEAVVDPELATMRSVDTPPENARRTVQVYASISMKAMTDDFWEALRRRF